MKAKLHAGIEHWTFPWVKWNQTWRNCLEILCHLPISWGAKCRIILDYILSCIFHAQGLWPLNLMHMVLSEKCKFLVKKVSKLLRIVSMGRYPLISWPCLTIMALKFMFTNITTMVFVCMMFTAKLHKWPMSTSYRESSQAIRGPSLCCSWLANFPHIVWCWVTPPIWIMQGNEHINEKPFIEVNFIKVKVSNTKALYPGHFITRHSVFRLPESCQNPLGFQLVLRPASFWEQTIYLQGFVLKANWAKLLSTL